MLDMILKEYLVIFTFIQTQKEPVCLILLNYLLFDLFLLFCCQKFQFVFIFCR